MMSSLRVRVADGKYRVTAPLRLGPSDSGVVFEALGDPGAATISGSRVITGWTLHAGSIYKATISATHAPFYTLFEDGVRARQARLPKLAPGASFPTAFAPYFTSQGVNGSFTQVNYGADLDPTDWNVTQVRTTIWSGGGICWFTDTIPLVAVNIGLHLLGFQQNTRYAINNGANGSRYFVQGILDFLTEPGEFAFDNATSTLYYWPVGDINDVTIEAPAVHDIFLLEGSPSNRVTDVVIDGFEIEHTDMVKWYRHAHVNEGDGFRDRDRGPIDSLATSDPYDRVMTLRQNRHGLIALFNCDALQLKRCHLKGAGLHGIWGGGTGGGFNKNHVIEDSHIEQLGHCGIYVDGEYPAAGDVSRDWTIRNVKVNDSGQLVGNGEGMIFINSGHHLVSHCDISRSPRNGFFIGAYVDIPVADCYAKGTVLEYTAISECCQDSGDVGGLGIGGISSKAGGPYLTNTVRQVTVDNIHAHPSMLDARPNGVFTDNQSYGQVFENVKVTDTQGVGMRINDSGEHTATNCTFNADGTTNGSFNAALMSPDIGLTDDFPF